MPYYSPVCDICAQIAPFQCSVKGAPVRSLIVRRIASGLPLLTWWWQTVLLIGCILCCRSLINFRGLLTGHQPSSISPTHASLHSPLLSSKSNEPGGSKVNEDNICKFQSHKRCVLFHLDTWRQKCEPLLPGVGCGCMLYGSLKWMQRQILTKLLTQ